MVFKSVIFNPTNTVGRRGWLEPFSPPPTLKKIPFCLRPRYVRSYVCIYRPQDGPAPQHRSARATTRRAATRIREARKGSGRRSPATSCWNWNGNSPTTCTCRVSGASRSPTVCGCPRNRSRSGSRTGGWNTRRRTVPGRPRPAPAATVRGPVTNRPRRTAATAAAVTSRSTIVTTTTADRATTATNVAVSPGPRVGRTGRRRPARSVPDLNLRRGRRDPVRSTDLPNE